MGLIPRILVHAVQGDGYSWPVVLHSHDGRACPDCGVIAIGANHRARHQALHRQLEQLEEAVHTLAKAVRQIAKEAGHEDWYEPEESPALGGIVIGNGPLPAEMRGGGD